MQTTYPSTIRRERRSDQWARRPKSLLQTQQSAQYQHGLFTQFNIITSGERTHIAHMQIICNMYDVQVIMRIGLIHYNIKVCGFKSAVPIRSFGRSFVALGSLIWYANVAAYKWFYMCIWILYRLLGIGWDSRSCSACILYNTHILLQYGAFALNTDSRTILPSHGSNFSVWVCFFILHSLQLAMFVAVVLAVLFAHSWISLSGYHTLVYV